MSCGRSEPAGLCGLRKQVTEAKEGLLDLRRKKARACALREEWGKEWQECAPERERACPGAFLLWGFILRSGVGGGFQ